MNLHRVIRGDHYMMRQQSQQNAQDNTPKKDLTKALIEKNPCGLCRAFELPKCNGHLVSGGSSSGGNEGEKSGSNNASHEENKLKSIFITDPANSPAHTFSNKDTKLEPVNYANATIELRPTYKTFNIEVINELLEKKILSIENKNDLGILIIQCNSALHDLLSDYEKDELNKFLDIVKEKFNDYKNRNNISPEDCSITFGKNNILC